MLNGTSVQSLLEFVIERDGATVSCRWCRASARLDMTRVAESILEFQEEHFECDPQLLGTE